MKKIEAGCMFSLFVFCLVGRDLRKFLPRKKGLASFICVYMENNEERQVRQMGWQSKEKEV